MRSLETLLSEALLSDPVTFRRATLSRRRDSSDLEFDKVRVRGVELKGEFACQFSLRTGKREAHENLPPAEAADRIAEWCRTHFHDCHLFVAGAEYAIRASANGDVHITRKAVDGDSVAEPESHNRRKSHLIPEGVACEFLVETGVMTADGRVRSARTRKFRQINRFLELVDDVIPSLPATGRLNVVDFGCGKSYLTFALHHLLTAIHQRDVQIAGLDRDPQIIEQCAALARRLRCRGLSFRQQDIADFEGFEEGDHVDLVVSLHACDTATDDALAKAIFWEAPVILAVPCCQHEVHAAMTGNAVSGLARHGILKERLAALATDAMRAAVLEQQGYRTQVVEFIDMEHTAKNILLRAVRRSEGEFHRAPSDELGRLKALLGIGTFRLEQILAESPPV